MNREYTYIAYDENTTVWWCRAIDRVQIIDCHTLHDQTRTSAVKNHQSAAFTQKVVLHTQCRLPLVKPLATAIPANTKHLYIIYTMLGQRRRRCINGI